MAATPGRASLIALLLLCGVTLLYFHRQNSEVAAQRVTESPAPIKAPNRAPEWCDTDVKVCSHRLKVDGLGDSARQSVVERMQVLAAQGVTCYDIDVVATREGFMLVAHPQALQEMLLRHNVSGPVQALTLAELQAAVGGPARLAQLAPLLTDLLREFSALPGSRERGGGEEQEAPQLFVELKGRAFSSSGLQYIAQQLDMLGISQTVSIWFPPGQPGDVELLRRVREAHGLRLKAGRSYIDSLAGPLPGSPRTAVQSEVTEQDKFFDFLGPSLAAQPAQLFLDIQRSGLPMVLWVVDTQPGLEQALKVGASCVISNKPLHIQALLKQMRRSNCSHGEAGFRHSTTKERHH
ncbi:hypothetical protein V8C86DRAFT_2507102 [Haematococcus lacustris]